MSRTASSLTLVAVVAITTAMACSSSSSGQPAQSSSDSGMPDTSTCGAQGCGQVDAASDVAPYDTGWVCPLIPESNVGSTCDACIQSSCDADWCTCAQSEVVVDAGPTGCLAYLACTMSCPVDSGSCADAGCAAASSQSDQQQAQTLLSCIAQSCATACPGLTTLDI
jgi:hypothetical protein